MTRPSEIIRGLGALTLLALLLLAFPIALYTVGGSPLPDRIPTWTQITAALMRPDTDHTLFLTAVRVIGWAGWLLFLTTIATETLGYLAGRSGPRMPRPVRPMQHLARDLVAMTALIFTAGTPFTTPLTPGPAHAVTTEAEATPPTEGPARSTNKPSPGRDTTQPHNTEEKPKRRGRRTRTIKRGDTLWNIARRHYGSGTHYPKIFKASRPLTQPRGLPRLTDPDRIYPGQRIRLPRLRKNPARTPPPHPNKPQHPGTPPAQPPAAEPTPAGTPEPRNAAPTPSNPAQSARSATPAPAAPPAPASRPADHASTISLPSGTHIGIGLAAALSVALAATRLHRRRRRLLNDTAWPGPQAPEPATPSAVAKTHKANLDTRIDHGEALPTDADLVTCGQAAPAPDHITVGTRNGTPVALPLSGLSLGLDGDGALATARAIATELLAKAGRDRVELLIPAPDAHALYPTLDTSNPVDALPGLTVVPTLNAAITHLEVELIRRARLLDTTDQPDLASLRATDPAEPLPTVLLLASAPGQTAATLHATLQLGRRYNIGGLLCGPWPTATATITTDGTVTHATGPYGDALTRARLFHLTADDAADMLHTLHTATGHPEPEHQLRHQAELPAPTTLPEPGHKPVPPPERTTQQRQPLVQIQLLGPVQLHTANGPISTGLRRSSRTLLAYLALHPNGITRDQGTAALWPDHDPDNATPLFHTAISNIRKTLRQATGLREPAFIVHAAGRYRLDRHLIDTDLWNLDTTLTRARTATDDTERAHALQPIADLYTDDFATDQTHEWAEAHREYLRRTAVDALAHLAQLTQDHDPERALIVLEHALHHDPYSEPLHRNIIKLQAHLDRPDAAHRIYRHLTTRLAELDTEPDDQTHHLMTQLSRSPQDH